MLELLPANAIPIKDVSAFLAAIEWWDSEHLFPELKSGAREQVQIIGI